MSNLIKIALSLFSKVDYTTLIGMAVSFILGGLLASQHYEIVMAEEMLVKEEAVQRQLEASLKEERENAEKLSVTITQRDEAMAEVSARERTIRSLLDGMRDNVRPNPVSTAKPDTCQSERRAIARCKSLLREGAELLAESSERMEHNAVNHDSLVRIVR